MDGMMASPFKQFEYNGWQQSASAYHDRFTPLTAQAISSTLRISGVKAGMDLVDLACGPGLLSSAAQQLGANVLGVDFSDAMVALAKASFPDVDFQKSDVEQLALADDSFDAAIMNFGLLHLGAPDLALKEVRRILKPGGRFVFTVWDQPTNAKGFQMVLEAIKGHGAMDVDLPDGPPFFLFSDQQHTFHALRDAGFCEWQVSVEPLRWRLNTPKDLYDAFYFGTARTGALLRAQNPSSQKAIKQKIMQDAEAKFGSSEDKAIEVPMPCLVYRACVGS